MIPTTQRILRNQNKLFTMLAFHEVGKKFRPLNFKKHERRHSAKHLSLKDKPNRHTHGFGHVIFEIHMLL